VVLKRSKKIFKIALPVLGMLVAVGLFAPAKASAFTMTATAYMSDTVPPGSCTGYVHSVGGGTTPPASMSNPWRSSQCPFDGDNGTVGIRHGVTHGSDGTILKSQAQYCFDLGAGIGKETRVTHDTEDPKVDPTFVDVFFNQNQAYGLNFGHRTVTVTAGPCAGVPPPQPAPPPPSDGGYPTHINIHTSTNSYMPSNTTLSFVTNRHSLGLCTGGAGQSFTIQSPNTRTCSGNSLGNSASDYVAVVAQNSGPWTFAGWAPGSQCVNNNSNNQPPGFECDVYVPANQTYDIYATYYVTTVTVDTSQSTLPSGADLGFTTSAHQIGTCNAGVGDYFTITAPGSQTCVGGSIGNSYSDSTNLVAPPTVAGYNFSYWSGDCSSTSTNSVSGDTCHIYLSPGSNGRVYPHYVAIVPPQPPPTVQLLLNNFDGDINLSTNSSLSVGWSSSNADSCSSSWQGGVATSGATDRSSDTSSAGTRSYSITCSNSGGSASSTHNVNVIAPPPSRTPYANTLYSDVHAGGGVGPNCTASGSTTYVKSNPNASATYIVSAINQVSGFGSAGSAASNALTFGNAGGNLGFYGTICRPDLVAAAQNYSNTVTYAAGSHDLTHGAAHELIHYTGASPLVINVTGVTTSVPKTIWVDGDLVLTGSAGASLARGACVNPPGCTRATLPTLGFIVTGNIYIDGNISSLYGLYWAGATIYTCADSGTTTPHDITSSVSFCSRPLAVNGQLMGSSLDLRRTGQNGATGASLAETISLSSDLYLAPPPGFGDVTTSPQFVGELSPKI